MRGACQYPGRCQEAVGEIPRRWTGSSETQTAYVGSGKGEARGSGEGEVAQSEGGGEECAVSRTVLASTLTNGRALT